MSTHLRNSATTTESRSWNGTGANGAPSSAEKAKVNGTSQEKPKLIYALDDKSIPIVWRIAFMLLVDPVLDYQSTAHAIWGPCDPQTAKNRVNAHLTQLKKSGVIESLGGNRYRVDKAKLVEESGLQLPEEWR